MAKRSKEVRDNVRARDCGECGICSSKKKTEVHHIVPLSDGGADDEENCILLCASHHTRCHDLYLDGSLTPSGFYAWLERERLRYAKS